MFEKLKELICQFVEIDKDEINESSRFLDDLGFNSFDFLSMLGEAENVFDIEIDDAIASEKKTVAELIEYFEGLE